MPRLTQRLIDSLRAEERDRIVFEETLPGFGVRVFRSGRKSYVIQHRSQKRTRRYTLGDCALFTPAQARKKAAKHLGRMSGTTKTPQRRVVRRWQPPVSPTSRNAFCATVKLQIQPVGLGLQRQSEASRFSI